VRLVLEDAELTASWLEELESMRARINQVREKLAGSRTAGAINLAPLGQQRGMFAVLDLSKEQILSLRNDHAVYMAGSGRINVAGLTMGNIDTFVGALAAVSG